MTPHAQSQRPDLEIIINNPGQSFRFHQHDYPSPLAKLNYHPEYELHLITDSQGIMYIGDCIEEFHPGNLCLIGPNIPHNWMSRLRTRDTVPGRDIALQFTRDSIGLAGTSSPPEYAELDALLKESHFGLIFEGRGTQAAIDLLLELRTQTGLEAFSTFLKLMSVLATKCDARRAISPRYRPSLSDKSTDLMDTIFAEISDDVTADIRMSKFANRFGMSDATFSRFFYRNCGMNFSHYVRKIRIGYACSLLQETELKVVDVANDSGFRNLSLFNRQFKAEIGKTPQQYRKLSQMLRA
ncbi:MAG: AraC family transcriptional regulator [Paracoccaceae bacterium]